MSGKFIALALLWQGVTCQLSLISDGNPIISDQSYYTADPGPIVVNGSLYIIAGQDSAPANDNSFVMNDWLLLASEHADPAGGKWTLYPNFTSPHAIFDWAAKGSAYASQIVVGPDGHFYMYAPVAQANPQSPDPFGIGVARADKITGPYTDHHPKGPIVSQSYPSPGNDIQNIDPTVLVDNGRVYMYWGTFWQLRGVELDPKDMSTFVGDMVTVKTLTGFFEASWLMKRGQTYYLLYASNAIGPECTPTSYHACIAYGTASHPLGPWTYRGVILGIVSSTTSHPGAVSICDEWFLVYHTADAVGGGHFRRSVAIDRIFFDDATTPPRIRPVRKTRRAQPASKPTYQRQQIANASSVPVCPVQYWIEAIHDQKIPANPLPPEYWCTYKGQHSPIKSTLTYIWKDVQNLNGVAMSFFADHDAGDVEGVAPPVSWFVEYQKADGSWTAVHNLSSYPTEDTDTPATTRFNAMDTRSLRATLHASTNGTFTAGVGVKEWIVYATTEKVVV